MSDAGLFVSEVLKGMSQGMMQGMEMRRQRYEFDENKKLKTRELDIREDMLEQDMQIKNLQAENAATKAQTDLQKTMAEMAIKQRKVALEGLAEERKSLELEIGTAMGYEKADLERQIHELNHNMKQKEFELKQMDQQLKMYQTHNDILSKRRAADQKDRELDLRDKWKGQESKDKAADRALKKKLAELKHKNDPARRVTPQQITSWTAGESALYEFDELFNLIDKNESKMGWGGAEGWFRAGKVGQAFLKDPGVAAYSQMSEKLSGQVTKLMEGGRPSEYDSKRWKNLIPRISDPSAKISRVKATQLRQLIQFEMYVNWHILNEQGYNMAGMEKPKPAKDPFGRYEASQVAKDYIREQGGKAARIRKDTKNMSREEKIRALEQRRRGR
jgi:hypothetical protein